MMTRAKYITYLCEASISQIAQRTASGLHKNIGNIAVGTAAGALGGATALHQARQEKHDKVRQAGMGKELDTALAAKKASYRKMQSRPFIKKHKEAHQQAKENVKHVITSGTQKFDKMTKGASDVGKSELSYRYKEPNV